MFFVIGAIVGAIIVSAYHNRKEIKEIVREADGIRDAFTRIRRLSARE